MPLHISTVATEPQLTDRSIAGRHGIGFWIVALAFTIAMAFSTMPSPLYPLYQQLNGFSTLTVTVVFAVYALGVAASLLLAGHASDVFGRKTILLTSLAAQFLAAMLFLSSTSLVALLAARFITGLGIGILTATATAYLQELHTRHRPGATSYRFDTVAAVANIGGLGIGPLISGVMAQWVEGPLRTPYAVFALLLAGIMFAVFFVPETTNTVSERTSYRPQKIKVHHGDRAGYAATTTSFASFAVIGLFTSVAPGFVAGPMNHPSRVVSGLVLFSVFAAATVSGVAAHRASAAVKMRFGLAGMAVGMLVLVAGTMKISLPLFTVGGMFSGLGAGVLFTSAIATVAASAAPAARSAALTGFFFVSYLGLSVPALGIGVATQFVALSTAITWLVAILLAIVAVVTHSIRGSNRSRSR